MLISMPYSIPRDSFYPQAKQGMILISHNKGNSPVYFSTIIPSSQNLPRFSPPPPPLDHRITKFPYIQVPYQLALYPIDTTSIKRMKWKGWLHKCLQQASSSPVIALFPVLYCWCSKRTIAGVSVLIITN